MPNGHRQKVGILDLKDPLASSQNSSVSDSRKISCGVHGWQDQTFVCQHITESLRTGIPVGFCWSSEQTDPRPDAWCSACEKARLEAGGDDWTPEVSEKLG